MIACTRSGMAAALWEAGFRVWSSTHLGLRARHSESDSDIEAICSWDTRWRDEPVQSWVVVLTVPNARGPRLPVVMTAGTLVDLVAALTYTINADTRAAA